MDIRRTLILLLLISSFTFGQYDLNPFQSYNKKGGSAAGGSSTLDPDDAGITSSRAFALEAGGTFTKNGLNITSWSDSWGIWTGSFDYISGSQLPPLTLGGLEYPDFTGGTAAMGLYTYDVGTFRGGAEGYTVFLVYNESVGDAASYIFVYYQDAANNFDLTTVASPGYMRWQGDDGNGTAVTLKIIPDGGLVPSTEWNVIAVRYSLTDLTVTSYLTGVKTEVALPVGWNPSALWCNGSAQPNIGRYTTTNRYMNLASVYWYDEPFTDTQINGICKFLADKFIALGVTDMNAWVTAE